MSLLVRAWVVRGKSWCGYSRSWLHWDALHHMKPPSQRAIRLVKAGCRFCARRPSGCWSRHPVPIAGNRFPCRASAWLRLSRWWRSIGKRCACGRTARSASCVVTLSQHCQGQVTSLSPGGWTLCLQVPTSRLQTLPIRRWASCSRSKGTARAGLRGCIASPK